MLAINKSTNGQASVKYLDSGLKTEGYYLKEEVRAFWEGKTACYLNLENKEVTREDFSRLVNNRHHETGDRLTRRDVENRRAGFDFTFSGIKSASALWAITRDGAILEAHREAVRQAMAEIESHAITQANTQYGRFNDHTGNILFAGFEHFTTRPCEYVKNGKKIYVPDPQIHTHCYSPNVTWHPEKGRFQAVEFGNVHAQAPYFEAVYHAHYAHGLRKVGYEIIRTKDRYEIAGVSKSIIDRYSNRTQIIEEEARKKGITDSKAKAQLGVKTRHSKGKSLNQKDVFVDWVERLTPEELKHLKTLKGKPQKVERPLTAKEAIDRSLEHHLERNSVAEEKRVLAHALTLGYGYLLPDDVTKELRSRSEVLRSDINGISNVTTKPMVHFEDKMLEMATSGKGKFAPLNPAYQPKQAILNDQQRRAVSDILSSRDQITILKGAAGVGKTTLLTEVKDGITDAGKSLFAIAPSSQAANVLKQKGFEADTIAGFLTNSQARQKLGKGQFLLVDEAGLCGIRVLSDVLSIAKQDNLRVILSGDTRQHGPPGQYGDAMRILEKKAALKTASVNKIVRQKPEDYLKAVEQLSKGRVMEGYQTLDKKMGAIVEIADTEERLNRIAEDYVQSVSQKRSALIVSPTHAEGEMINRVVREKLKAQGRIQGREREIETLKSINLTDSQKKDLALYNDSQILRFIRNQKGGYKAGNEYEVFTGKNGDLKVRDRQTKEVLKLPHNEPENYQVYEKRNIELAKGDLIRLTANAKTIENTKMFNGTSYEVKGFNKSGDIMLSNGKTLPARNGHFTYGYCETSHSSQGKDTKDVFVSVSEMSFGGASVEQFYVSVSRGTDSAKVYTSDKDTLKRAISKTLERTTAREIADAVNYRALQTRQRDYYQKSLFEKIRYSNERDRNKLSNRPVPKRLEHPKPKR